MRAVRIRCEMECVAEERGKRADGARELKKRRDRASSRDRAFPDHALLHGSTSGKDKRVYATDFKKESVIEHAK